MDDLESWEFVPTYVQEQGEGFLRRSGTWLAVAFVKRQGVAGLSGEQLPTDSQTRQAVDRGTTPGVTSNCGDHWQDPSYFIRPGPDHRRWSYRLTGSK